MSDYEMTPPVDGRRGRWCSGCRGWCSARRDFGNGCTGGRFIDDGLVGGEGGDEGLERKVVDRARITPAGLMNERDRVVGEQRVVAPGRRQVVAQVAAGLGVGHGWHCVAQPDALVERGEHAEFHPPPQGGLADEQTGERAGGVEVMTCQEPQRFQLVVAEQVRFVDFSDRRRPDYACDLRLCVDYMFAMLAWRHDMRWCRGAGRVSVGLISGRRWGRQAGLRGRRYAGPGSAGWSGRR